MKAKITGIQFGYELLGEGGPTVVLIHGFGLNRNVWLPEITVPALVAAGEQDQIIDLENAKQMADDLPNSTFLSLPQAGHLPMLETPGTLGKGLLTLVRRVEALEGK